MACSIVKDLTDSSNNLIFWKLIINFLKSTIKFLKLIIFPNLLKSHDTENPTLMSVHIYFLYLFIYLHTFVIIFYLIIVVIKRSNQNDMFTKNRRIVLADCRASNLLVRCSVPSLGITLAHKMCIHDRLRALTNDARLRVCVHGRVNVRDAYNHAPTISRPRCFHTIRPYQNVRIRLCLYRVFLRRPSLPLLPPLRFVSVASFPFSLFFFIFDSTVCFLPLASFSFLRSLPTLFSRPRLLPFVLRRVFFFLSFLSFFLFDTAFILPCSL